MSHQESLELIEAANRRMAEQAKAPVWYHWALGAMVGGLCAVQALTIPWVIAYEAATLAGMVWLMRAYRQHTGMWIPGYRAGRTRWVAFSSAVLGGAIFLAAIVAVRRTGQTFWYPVGGVVLGLTATARGYAWEKAFRRDLGVE